jgi:glycerol-1-phosphate dehydrogenase [NAD(P)+]
MNLEPVLYYYGADATYKFVDYCTSNHFRRFMLVCDQNTFEIFGSKVETIIRSKGWELKRVILEGKQVVVDGEYLLQVLMQSDAEPCVYLAVGSGTITDITRFCSHRTRNPFISLPTAPSVDGFASLIAAVVVGGFKGNALAQPPLAIFGDSQVLCAAPPEMVAAGFGDLLGKYISLADWKLGHLLWDTPYNAGLADRVRRALTSCVENVAGLQKATPEGVSTLLAGLVDSGICMLLNGNSLPASGSEHHLSHYWEMKLLRQGRPPILHGAKVGIATVLSAGRYEQIRKLSHREVEQRLRSARPPEQEMEGSIIERVYGPIADQVRLEQRYFLEINAEEYSGLKAKIVNHWEEILQIAAEVPPTTHIVELLHQVSAPTDVYRVGLDSEDEREALDYAHYLRNQFTIGKLGKVLGIW